MGDTSYILNEKYTVKLFKEGGNFTNTIKSMTDSPTNGGLYLTKESVIFRAGDTALTRMSNPIGSRTSEEIYNFSDINRVEVGDYMNLWKKIYTLRIYLKDGSRKSFMMENKTRAERWCSTINRLIKQN